MSVVRRDLSHLKLLISWPVYLAFYIITERYIAEEHCHVIYSPLDDLFEFCELFVIPYVLWYLWLVGSLIYFAFYDVKSFRHLQIFLIIVQAVAVLTYIFYPSVQYLRPDVYPRDNFLTDIVALIQTVDTPTGVFPSLHVAFSCGLAFVWTGRDIRTWLKVVAVVLAVIISLSTLYIKQHSVLDAFYAVTVSVVAEWLIVKKG